MTVIRNLATIQQTPKIWRSAFKMLAMIIKAARKTAGTKPIKFKHWFSLATPNLPLSTSAKNLDLVDGLIVNSVYSAILATDVRQFIVRNLLITKVRGNVLQLHVLNWR